MNISEEKRFVYEMMRTVMDERRTLTDIYFSLKKKLDDLEEIEKRGLDSLSLKGYVDMHNEREHLTMLENTRRELAHITQKLENKKDEKEISQPSVIPSHVIAEQKFRDNNKIIKNKPAASERKSSRAPKRPERTKRIQEMVIEEMKNNKDKPFNAGEMHELLLYRQEFRDFECELKEFRGNMFFRAVNSDPDIIKAGTGKYKYTG